MSLLLGWLPGKSYVSFRKGTITLRACPSCFSRTIPIHFRLTPPSRFNLIWWDWLNKPQVRWFHRTEMVSQTTNGLSFDLTKLDEQTPRILGLIKIQVVYTQKKHGTWFWCKSHFPGGLDCPPGRLWRACGLRYKGPSKLKHKGFWLFEITLLEDIQSSPVFCW